MGEISRRKRQIHARSVCNNCNLDFLFNLEASAPIKKTQNSERLNLPKDFFLSAQENNSAYIYQSNFDFSSNFQQN